MRVEDLKGWLAAARIGKKKGETAEKEGGGRQDTREGADNWARLVELVQTAFRDGVLDEEATWQAGEGGPAPHTGGVVPPSGVVQGGS